MNTTRFVGNSQQGKQSIIRFQIENNGILRNISGLSGTSGQKTHSVSAWAGLVTLFST